MHQRRETNHTICLSMNFYETLKTQLQKIPELINEEGNIKKWVVVHKAQNFDEKLISLLLDNQILKKEFFINIKGILVFNQYHFIRFLEYKNYFNDSYTQYKNKVGLIIAGKHLKQRNEVALVWPYKDCVLEGGQSREKDKREEIFFNETLAQDEITQLLSPKVLTNAKVFDKDGEHVFSSFHRDAEVNRQRGLSEYTITDNLIIKGNNLLALHSIKKEFVGKVKLIYIDPPYNTGGDGFKYNDNFNHSTWLTFMKNRLEVARELLRDDGVIFVQCDDNEQAYLKVLMDSIFGREDFQSCISVIVKPEGRNYGNIAKTHEYLLLYSKTNSFQANEIEIINKSFKHEDKKGKYNLKELRNGNSAFHIENRPNLFYPILIDINQTDENDYCKVVVEKSSSTIEVFPKRTKGVQTVWRWGREKVHEELEDIIAKKNKDGTYSIYQKTRKSTIRAKSFWNDKESYTLKGNQELESLLGSKAFSYPKPEALISNIIKLSTKNNDIIIDFNLGSGTTAAVAHKMGRQYIGIEQMDYIETISVERMKKVIEGEQGGISKSVNWQGGGSFTYFELKKYNQNFIKKIEVAKDTKTLLKVWEEMKKESFLNYNVDIKKQENNMKGFKELSFKKQKQHLCELLDKNQMYINLSSLKDKDLSCTKEEEQVTRDFYQ